MSDCSTSTGTDLVGAVTELLYGAPTHSKSQYVAILNDDEANTLPVFLRCLTTGTEEARELAEEILTDIFDDMHKAKSAFEQTLQWEDRCRDAFHPHAVRQVLCGWNAMNVLSEIDELDEESSGDIIDLIEGNREDYAVLVPALAGYPVTDEYWRGVAAFAATCILPGQDSASDINGYLELTGTHPDLRRVIHLARERNTVNADELKAIMQEQDATASVLTSGVL